MIGKDKHLLSVGSIVQVSPEHESQACALAHVTAIHTWGVEAILAGGVMRFVWSLIEPTGGTVLWNRNGTKFRAPEAPARHHP